MLGENDQLRIKALQNSYPEYDRTSLLALAVGDQLIKKHGNSLFTDQRIALNIGSARGVTETWEKYHTEFISTQQLPSQTSPQTTAGSIASRLIHHLRGETTKKENIISFEHYSTCNSSAVAVANGYAWLKSGLCDVFIAGGAEMPLTAFTFAQMKALRIYTPYSGFPFCRPFNTERNNSFCLGEGAALLLMQAYNSPPSTDYIEIECIGYASEKPPSLTGISLEAENIQGALSSALSQLPEGDDCIDAIIAHAPGTVKGDHAEFSAYKKFFKNSSVPPIIITKHLTGHTFGASAAINICKGIELLMGLYVYDVDYNTYIEPVLLNTKPRRIAVICTGFGGMAMCILLKKYI